MSISIKARQVEVRIRSHEVEDIILLAAEPVFPALVPAFYQQGVESVLGCEIDVSAHILIVGAVAAVRLGLGIIGLSKLD